MSLTILAPAYYSDWNKVRYLKQSAERHNAPIYWYGFGKPYTNWYQIQIIDLLEELKNIDSDYVLYTDASDAIINTKLYPPPPSDKTWIIMSQEHDGGLCAGGWFGPRKYAIECLEFFKDYTPTNSNDPTNPQERWREAAKHGLVSVHADYARAFFQVADEPLEIIEGMLYNPRTQTFPAVVHWAGGFSHQLYGKYDKIHDTWIKLGYDELEVE